MECLKLSPGQIRIPDVSYMSWDRLPGRKLPSDPIPRLAPDLAVEVIGAGNTREEMNRKLHEYFAAGVRLVWYDYPATRSVDFHTGVDEVISLDDDAILGGGDVLVGFQLPLAKLFQTTSAR